MNRLLLLPSVLLIGLAGCGDADPGVVVDDPMLYLRDQLRSTSAPPWTPADTPEYHPDDPAFLDSVLQVTLARGRGLDVLPTDSRQLDRVVRRAAQTYRLRLLDTPSRRAAVEARIREHFETSPVELRGTTAVTNLGLAPGHFERTRISWAIQTSPKATADLLRPDVVAETLARMQEAQPSARAFLIHVKIPDGPSPHPQRYFYARAEDRLRMRQGSSQYVSKAAVGGLEGLRDRPAPAHVLDVFEPVCVSDHEPDCPDVWNP